ncbi:MAG: penicillin-insensitive murein endopeptidase [Pseudomonadota bacterium]
MFIRLCLLILLITTPAAADPLAKPLFGRWSVPSEGNPEPLGGYSKGCLAGGLELAETGASWQAMRLSRNRNWGHPDVIAFVDRLGSKAQSIGWSRLYIGDMSQPRGGPISGHASHQIGMDVDIWLAKPVVRELSRQEREQVGSPSVVRADKLDVNKNWTPDHHDILKAAAQDPAVTRIFVNAAIKQAMCRREGGEGRAWMRKIRPWWGHDSHFHVRLRCPDGAADCIPQDPPPAGNGCDATLAWWFTDEGLGKVPPKTPSKPKAPLRMSDLPLSCGPVAQE